MIENIDNMDHASCCAFCCAVVHLYAAFVALLHIKRLFIFNVQTFFNVETYVETKYFIVIFHGLYQWITSVKKKGHAKILCVRSKISFNKK